MDGHIYKALKAAGFPQGGSGGWFSDPKTDEKFYMPKPEELYTQFLGDPKDWEKMTEAMSVVWIERHTGVPYHDLGPGQTEANKVEVFTTGFAQVIEPVVKLMDDMAPVRFVPTQTHVEGPKLADDITAPPVQLSDADSEARGNSGNGNTKTTEGSA